MMTIIRTAADIIDPFVIRLSVVNSVPEDTKDAFLYIGSDFCPGSDSAVA